MALIVQAPTSYEAERRYVLGVVLGEWLGLDWRLVPGDRPDIVLRLAGESGEVVLPDVLFGTPAPEWLRSPSLPRLPLASLPAGQNGEHGRAGTPLPVLYGRTGDGLEAMRRREGAVDLSVDVFGSAFFMLTRYEELVASSVRDDYDRFPASSSVVGRAGLLTVPIVDVYVELLWAAITRCWPRLRRAPRDFSVVLSHDVDDPLATLGRTTVGRVRQLAADLVLRRDGALAARRVASLAAPGERGRRLDPHNTFDFLMDISERHGWRSAFYFMAHRVPSPRDGPYRVDDPWIRSLIARIHRRGHEVGFHGSFDSYTDAERTRDEFARLRAVAEQAGVAQEHWGGRQHYLRWTNPTTWRNWDHAGLAYDSTLAYADAVGFRAGTCHAYPVFDLERRCTLRLREHPFHVMDATLFRYMSLSPDAAEKAVLDLADQCRRHRGALGILWHNSALLTTRQKRWYESLLAAVSAR